MSDFTHSMVTILVGIITVALVAVLVSKNAQTPEVTKSFFQGFSQALGTATGPVSGGSFTGASYGNMGLNQFG